jgi:murein DD-endopeptidase MepM/ murein hydrolase activator NlpD
MIRAGQSGMETMDRRLKLALVTMSGLLILGWTLLLTACTETPETQLSWGVNDHLGQASQPAPSQARTYVYEGDHDGGQPLAAPPRPAPVAPVEKNTLPPIGRQIHVPLFDWPAMGKVIADFGARENGQRNDGINIAMKKGAPIRAAAGGTVSYSGDALKDYGNLVLIRHDGGYVTAYAHAEKLLVHRGEAVRQGEVIAYAGATGDVKSPQLHFEIRQGTTPVDPDALLSPRNS